MIKEQKTRSLKTKDNGRSSDAISPNYIYGCLGGCMKSYCYVGRFNPDNVYVNQNINDIEKSVEDWIEGQVWPKVPNQVDDTYYTIDIGCNTDMSLMQKYIDLESILDFYVQHPKAKATFATKYPSRLKIEGKGQRVRISLMPEYMRHRMERFTDHIYTRIQQYHRLVDLGWEVHLNFSPVIVYDNWKVDYVKLFQMLKDNNINTKCEVIFLTHHIIKHEDNQRRGFKFENHLWNPKVQEPKTTSYGTEAIRYKRDLKAQGIQTFKNLYGMYWDLNTIRYIF